MKNSFIVVIFLFLWFSAVQNVFAEPLGKAPGINRQDGQINRIEKNRSEQTRGEQIQGERFDERAHLNQDGRTDGFEQRKAEKVIAEHSMRQEMKKEEIREHMKEAFKEHADRNNDGVIGPRERMWADQQLHTNEGGSPSVSPVMFTEGQALSPTAPADLNNDGSVGPREARRAWEKKEQWENKKERLENKQYDAKGDRNQDGQFDRFERGQAKEHFEQKNSGELKNQSGWGNQSNQREGRPEKNFQENQRGSGPQGGPQGFQGGSRGNGGHQAGGSAQGPQGFNKGGGSPRK